MGLANLAYMLTTREMISFIWLPPKQILESLFLIGKLAFHHHPISEGQMENAHHHYYSPRLSLDSNTFNYIHPSFTQKVHETGVDESSKGVRHLANLIGT